MSFPLSPFLDHCDVCTDAVPHHVFSQTFRIKWFLAKKQKQNHPIPPLDSYENWQ